MCVCDSAVCVNLCGDVCAELFVWWFGLIGLFVWVVSVWMVAISLELCCGSQLVVGLALLDVTVAVIVTVFM